MAVDVFGVAWRSQLSIRRHPILCLRKARYGKSTFATEPVSDSVKYNDRNENEDLRARKRNEPEWEKLSSKELGIKMASISKSTRVVLSALRKNGHEVYLVGGCVRDLILKRTPKDFDIITSAELKEVRNSFGCSEIVGKRFPICHVRVNDTTIEVSSFSTFAKNSGERFDEAKRPPGCDRHDYIRWRNCISRDFTINGLMFDPYAKIVYDYTGGLQDIRKSKMRTVKPAKISFVEDCARILRAVRIAARLGFRFTKDTALSLRELSYSVRRLDKGRILLEMNYMMAFGSSEASLRLLWRFGLLETLLPIQASYLASQGFRRRDERSNMLLRLFSNLDKFLAPDQPCHTSLWVAILAFHMALVEQPRNPLVVSALCLAISGGGSLSAAANMAAKISEPHDTEFDEIVEPERALSKTALVNEIFDLTESAKFALHKMTNPSYVSRAMAKFPKAPRSNLVFISVALSVKVCKIFDLISRRKVGDCNPKIGERVNYDSLAFGTMAELQSLFATVVFNTIYPSKSKT